MGLKSKIEWTDATWNPIIGCSKVSEGCRNCYAERMAMRFGATGRYYRPVMEENGYGTLIGWSGKTSQKKTKLNPLTTRKPKTIFVCSKGDLFHESVPFEWIDEVMKVIVAATWHRFMVLTKRPARMKEYMEKFPWGNPPQNLALGVSVENQETADERVPLLLETPAFRRFVSAEPLLGPIDLNKRECLIDKKRFTLTLGNYLDLVIVGGESSPKARPMHPDWVRLTRDQCADSNVPFMFKQWGEFIEAPVVKGNLIDYRASCVKITNYGNPIVIEGKAYSRIGKKAAGRLLDGVEHNGKINWENLCH